MYRRMNPRQVEQLIKKLQNLRIENEKEIQLKRAELAQKDAEIDELKKSTAPPILDRP